MARHIPSSSRKRSSVAITAIVLSALAGIALGVFILRTSPAETEEVAPLSFIEKHGDTAPLPTAAPTDPAVQAAIPTELIIPELNVRTLVEHVGLDQENKMDVPKNADQVAWYKFGPPPGAPGNAVIAGHLDSEHGPAVFYSLPELTSSDTFTVKDENGNSLTFQVTEVVTYALEEFPMDEVFGAHNKARLNLITCGGKFNNQTRNYSHRTVVYSELVQ